MIKIIFEILICAVLIIYLRNINIEFSVVAIFLLGIIVIYKIVPYIENIKSFIDNIILTAGIEKSYVVIILKITLIGYLIEFSSSLLKDFNLNSLAIKLELFGKIVIVSISLPIFYAVFNLLTGLL